ncbi:MAG: hypothetical protein ACK583_03790 [Cyanobacteriota bacterium]
MKPLLLLLTTYLCFRYKMAAAAAGTVTLSEIKVAATTTTKVWSDVHLYTKLFNLDEGQRGYFDHSLFYNLEEFTMSFNEQHKLLMQGYPCDKDEYTVYRARLNNNNNNNNNHELTIDMQHEPGQLCYVITLMTPNITLTVGPKTSLALLLQSGHLRVTMYMVTEELAKQLKQPLQERDRVRHQVNSVHQAALDCSSRDPRKRKAVNSLFRPIAQYRPCSPTTTPPPALF